MAGAVLFVTPNGQILGRWVISWMLLGGHEHYQRSGFATFRFYEREGGRGNCVTKSMVEVGGK